jgi:hypothetical protein
MRAPVLRLSIRVRVKIASKRSSLRRAIASRETATARAVIFGGLFAMMTSPDPAGKVVTAGIAVAKCRHGGDRAARP